MLTPRTAAKGECQITQLTQLSDSVQKESKETREGKNFTQKGHKKTFQNHRVKVAADSYSKNCTKQFWKVVK